MKKFLALLVVALFTMTCSIGCGDKTKTDDKKTDAKTDKTKT